jgi:lysophospholipase L1-like esterase
MLVRLLYSLLIVPALALGASLAPPGMTNVALAEVSAPPKRPPYRVLRQGMFALSRIDSASVIMLGDSLTEGAQWSEITGCRFLANRGIGADDSAGVARRLDEVTKLKPAAVFLMIGVNDVASNVPTATIVDNVQQTIDVLTKAGTRVYLTLVLPVGESYRRQINPKLDELNAAYREMAEQPNVSLIDFRSAMRTETGFLRNDFTVDGIHLTPEGYRVWRDAIGPFVEKHCPMRTNALTTPPDGAVSGRSSARAAESRAAARK